jgi:phosphoglycolate phosphatase
MIGDRAEDIHAAHANGIPSIAVGWGYGSEAELAEATPTSCAGAMADVLRWVEMQAAS